MRTAMSRIRVIETVSVGVLMMVIQTPSHMAWTKRERVRKDSKRVESKRKCWGRSERHFISVGGGGRKSSI
jgi:hypothetical protein